MILEYVLSVVLALVGLFIWNLLTADEIHITVNDVDKTKYDKVESEDDEDEE